MRREAGECPEWQRELTVNQPSSDFEGSSPSSPTTLHLLRKLQLGQPRLSESCRAKAQRAAAGRVAQPSPAKRVWLSLSEAKA
jgi:hypothetical protein